MKKIVTLNEDILRRAGISRAGKGFCYDASVMPSSLGLPVIWAVVALGKRFGKHLDVPDRLIGNPHTLLNMTRRCQQIHRGVIL